MPSVNNFDQFGKLLMQVIKAGDVETADRLLTHLYPFLSEKDQTDTQTDVLGYALKRGSLPIKQLFIRRLGLTPAAAYEYIKDCLEYPKNDRTLLDETANHLEQFYGVLQVSAVILGDVEIAETLLKNKPDRDVAIDFSNIRDNQILLDGEECWFRSEFMHDISSRQLKRVFEILDQAGLRDLLDHKTPLIDESNFKDSRHSTKSVAFEGDLPMLADGVLTHPELFLAFSALKSQHAFGNVYGKIPCWVRDAEHENSQQLIKFEKIQYLFDEPMKIDIGKISKQDLGDLIERSILGVRLGLSCESNLALTKLQTTAANALIIEILPLHLQCGFNTPSGFVMALVDVDYLSQFCANGYTSANMTLAKCFSEQFFPATALFNSYSHRSRGMSDGDIGVNSYDSARIFSYLSDSTVKDSLLKLIPSELWSVLFRSCSYKLQAKELLNARDLFGFTNLDSNLSLSLSDVLVLHEAGYKFGGNGHRCVLEAKEDVRDANPHIMVKYIQMGGWPSSLPRPTDMEDALSLAVRKRTDQIYNLYLQSVGAEESLKAASTPAQYKLVFDLFTSSELNPHLKLVPRHLRGKHLEDQLGL